MSNLGDRMKLFESISNLHVMPLTPVCVRLDGKAFHSFTRGFGKPFDQVLKTCMEVTATELLEAYNAKLAYTQSDEISLIFLQRGMNMNLVFSGRIQKICSILASHATVAFNRTADKLDVEGAGKAMFDCRAWNLPNVIECANYLIWREQDAVRNSIQMAARSVFSHKECTNKDSKDLQEMLFQKGINWNDYPACFKRGTYIRNIKVKRKFTVEELCKLPEKHDARKYPELEYDRTDTIQLDIPILNTIPIEDRVHRLFGD